MQMKKVSTGPQRINHIFISHLHGDHFYGLIGLISTYHLLGRSMPLNIYSVSGLKEIIELQLKLSRTDLAYPLEFHELDPENAATILETDQFLVKSIPMDHRIPACGFLIAEKPLKRNILKEFARSVKVPTETYDKIRNGEDFIDSDGKVYPNRDITIDPPLPRSYAYCSDTSYFEPIVDVIKGADVLFHEATFADDKKKDAFEKGHSTAREAATIAKLAEVSKLYIGHFSARYKDPEILLKEARQVFSNAFVAEDGMEIQL